MHFKCTAVFYWETITHAQLLELYITMNIESRVAGFPFNYFHSAFYKSNQQFLTLTDTNFMNLQSLHCFTRGNRLCYQTNYNINSIFKSRVEIWLLKSNIYINVKELIIKLEGRNLILEYCWKSINSRNSRRAVSTSRLPFSMVFLINTALVVVNTITRKKMTFLKVWNMT